ncbi:hypothetical protein SEA_YECEY3_91 [Mycobacterium phage Yecey3]|uniref:Uncharacterized protein n=1 Tax=Mycobacterium phage Yecey3 TaxID=2656617 RepID=A0A649VA93_9CAUD|nr:hypothetical protein KIV58_gp018 [Mycobacterium phage Yecey3]QGJ88842.1 hypothetical protein SEA_YECEY3_91 [Mycobacterium phage Yecey3]
MSHYTTNALLGLIAAGAALAAMALAEPPEASARPSQTVTVDGIDYPVCDLEDCSDQPGQIGVWINSEGQHWLSVGETSYLIER